MYYIYCYIVVNGNAEPDLVRASFMAAMSTTILKSPPVHL